MVLLVLAVISGAAAVSGGVSFGPEGVLLSSTRLAVQTIHTVDEKGTWELVSREVRDEAAGVMKADVSWARGLMMLDGKHFAYQLVGKDRPGVARATLDAAGTEDVRALAAGYMSSIGTYAPGEAPGVYVFTPASGLFAAEPSAFKLEVDGDRLQFASTDGKLTSTWQRTASDAAGDHALVGFWTLEKAENRPNTEADWAPFFVGSKGYTAFDPHGHRIWDVTLAGRSPLAREAALDPATQSDALKALLRTYLVGVVDYEIDTDKQVLTQVGNDGVFPGEGVRDWTYAFNDDGKLVITTALGTFRATYAPWD